MEKLKILFLGCDVCTIFIKGNLRNFELKKHPKGA